MRRWLVAAAFAVVVSVVLVAGCHARGPRVADAPRMPVPTTTVPAGPDATVPTRDGTWIAWQWVSEMSGECAGSDNAATETTTAESMVKAWIGADYIASADARDRRLTTDERSMIEKMIRSSDDAAAQRLYLAGGGDAMIRRLIDQAGLSGTSVAPGWWSRTRMTALDATRMMRRILERAKDSAQIAWLVALMRDVEPSNAFGIPQALPAPADPAVKNGWTAHDDTGQWHVNSLAAWDGNILAVLTRYPVAYGQDYGAELARQVTARLLARRG